KSFGASKLQTLKDVQLPLASPTIFASFVESAMIIFMMVVYASLIGAPGLGVEILRSLGRLRIGVGIEAGIAIALIALLLDSLLGGFHETIRG
ncbi:glycine/betaine ABC transporter, partial [candidate division MSBL1 archaeon SCGC-AAA259M10]